MEHGRVVIGETCINASVEDGFLRHVGPLVAEARYQVENRITADPFFAETFSPVAPSGDDPVVLDMCSASVIADVGPMAAVAGAIAGYVVDRLVEMGCRRAVVDNGGDVCIHSDTPIRVGVSPGVGSGILVLELPACDRIGVCSSSGTMGHSLSLGSSDVSTVISGSPALADACATRLGNGIRSPGDLVPSLELVGSFEGVVGCLAVKDRHLATFGDVPLS